MELTSTVSPISLNLKKESFKDVYEGRNRFIYRLTLTKELAQSEKASWEYFINHHKYKFNNTDNSVTELAINKSEISHNYILSIVRYLYFAEERFLGNEFNQAESDSKFVALITDIFTQFIKWKELRDFKPIEESKKITLDELGIKADEYIIS